ncbi:MAG: photosynthetic protein synthase I [Deinococcus sp.]|nr:photosynthetic protein synthase I [Deinococcus sp.]
MQRKYHYAAVLGFCLVSLLLAYRPWAAQATLPALSLEAPAETLVIPFIPLPGEAPPAARVALGKYLFFDERLSGDATTSCASCHLPERAWTDGQPLSAGYPNTPYFRNTPTLLNLAFQANLYWDGRLSGGDLESAVRDHLTEAHFMNADGQLVVERLKQVPQYETAFREAFGSGPSFGNLLSAVSTYLRRLVSTASPYDRYLAGEPSALSSEAVRGLALFNGRAGCAQCHSGPLLSDSQFHNLGVPQNPLVFAEPLRHVTFRRFFRGFGVVGYRDLREDPGAFILTQQMEDWGTFRTAPLREVCYTAPYMHNGIFTTLEEVVAFYHQGGGDAPNKDPLLAPLALSESDQADLVAFLKSLCGELAPASWPEVPPYQLRPLGDNS